MTEQTYTFRLCQAVARHPQMRLAAPVDLELNPAEQVAIAGANGAGKSLLVDLLTGKLPLSAGSIAYDFRPSTDTTLYNNVKYIAFRDTYGSADANYYYQQRWNAHDQDDAPLVRDMLDAAGCTQQKETLFDLFHLRPLLDKRIILLSSGELRKLQIAKALLTNPRILIMDNPFIGLDADTRTLLFRLLEELSRLRTLQIVLVVSRPEDIPAFITHVIPVENKVVLPKMTREAYLSTHATPSADTCPGLEERILGLPSTPIYNISDEVVRLSRVSIRYGDRTILKDLDWVVRQGEKWALSGENGAGKSTLLSLLCADNPQSYACDIRLFGRRRGSGESIWDIKRRIGYVSPELFAVCNRPVPAVDVVAGGLHDTLGLLRRTSAVERDRCMAWMRLFGADAWADVPYTRLSSGEQRLVLLVRAFVKSPPLLVLDEPFQGLDDARLLRARALLDAYVRTGHHTLIMVSHYENELPPCIDRRLHLVKHDEN